jgi:MFS family permease
MAVQDSFGEANKPSTTAGALWSLMPSVFLPAMLFEIGNGAVSPVLVLTARALGAPVGVAALLLGLVGIGRIVGDIPASYLARWAGDRYAMASSAMLMLCASFFAYIANGLASFSVALVLMGMSSSAFYLARHSHLIEVAPIRLRARAMSTLGGSHRIGLFIGPLIGTLAIRADGTRAVYIVAMAASVITVITLLVVRELPLPADDQSARVMTGKSASRTTQARVLGTLGIGILGLGAVRAARQIVLPLWGTSIGISPASVSLIFSISNAIDMTLFYPAGRVMDTYGRSAIAVPTCVVMGVSMLLTPLTHGVFSLGAVSVLMSIGNGMGTGIMLTLGADAAPASRRLQFLGLWRLMSDSGNAVGPFVISIVASVWALEEGIVAIGLVALGSGAALGYWIPKYSPYSRMPRSRG